MTHDDWISLLRTAIEMALPPLCLWIIGEITGLFDHAQDWLQAHRQFQLARVVGMSNTMLQAAMENEAGNMQLAVHQGELDPLSATSVRNWATRQAGIIRTSKLPDAVAATGASEASLTDGITGKFGNGLPDPVPVATPQSIPAPARPAPTPLPDLAGGSFQARAAIVIGRLMRDLQLERFQAAGIVGNLGQESGLEAVNELRPVGGRGGWGWAQWTGPRRREMEAWCLAQNLSVTDPEANYGFLVHELQTDEKAALDALRQTTTLEEATRVFEEKYERAGVAALARRQTFAEQAMAA